MEGQEQAREVPGHGELARALAVLAAPVRLALLHRLAHAAFVPDLAREFAMTRQAVKKHIEALLEVDLVVATPSRRGALPATSWSASPTGLFAFKEGVAALALVVDPSALGPAETRASPDRRPTPERAGWGVLLVHGDAPGRWFRLAGKPSWIVGRDAKSDVALTYDAIASARHALLRQAPTGWTITDLESTNGTRVNFRPVTAGQPVAIRSGDLLSVGKSHLLFRDGT